MKKVIIMMAVLAMAVPVMAFHPNEDCDSCHIPHTIGVNGSLDGVPLWSGTATSNAVFVNYDSPTMDAETTDPKGSTLLCLACHDASGHSINKEAGNLSTTHPIEFVYDGSLATEDGELVTPGLAGTSTLVNGKGTIKDDLLADGNVMNCMSCHDVHVSGLHRLEYGTNDDNDNFNSRIPHLVNIPEIKFATGYKQSGVEEDHWSLSYGALCTTCHIK